MKARLIFYIFPILIYNSYSCKRIIEISPPANTITTVETFTDSANATGAIAGLYSKMVIDATFMSRQITVNCGESADELIPFNSGGDQFFSNSLISRYAFVRINFWNPAYQYIYQTNAIIDGVQSSLGLTDTQKSQLLGEAKFLRSLYYFYLINLYGDVPLVNTIDYRISSLSPRTPTSQIYTQIISDLKEAQASLPYDYSNSGGERIRASHWAATALLARVYLYQQKWDSAEAQSTAVINNTGLFALNPDLNSVFQNNASGNMESILQWLTNSKNSTFNATLEGALFVPFKVPNNRPNYYMSKSLLNAFEPGDLRKVAWLDSIIYRSTNYFIPYKYKIGVVQAIPDASPTENLTVLRLAEQYLIRAEARAQKNDLAGALSDLNSIRERAGLGDLSSSLLQTEVLDAVARERRIELLAEWGHRWFDLKRTGKVDMVMKDATPQKGQGTSWQSYQQLYPIPYLEITTDPNLKQTSGY